MHDDIPLTVGRVTRVLKERILPGRARRVGAAHGRVARAAGRAGPAGRGARARLHAVCRGHPVGRRLGHDVVPPHRPRAGALGRTTRGGGRRPRLRPRHDRLPVRGPRLPRRRHAREVAQPAQPVGARRRRGRGRARPSSSTSRPPSNPILVDDQPLRADAARATSSRARRRASTRRGRLDLAVFERDVFELALDVEVLLELQAELPAGPRRMRVLQALDDALDRLDLQHVAATAADARAALVDVLAQPAEASAHAISAIGHAHIDSAWLWPVRETIRKVARTTSSMTTLIDETDDFVYGMSSAQQYAWIKEHRPEVWRACPGRRGGRALRAARRHVGRERHRHAVGRVARAPVPPRPALLRDRARHPLPRASGCPTASATRPPCRS